MQRVARFAAAFVALVGVSGCYHSTNRHIQEVQPISYEQLDVTYTEQQKAALDNSFVRKLLPLTRNPNASISIKEFEPAPDYTQLCFTPEPRTVLWQPPPNDLWTWRSEYIAPQPPLPEWGIRLDKSSLDRFGDRVFDSIFDGLLGTDSSDKDYLEEEQYSVATYHRRIRSFVSGCYNLNDRIYLKPAGNGWEVAVIKDN